MKCKLKRYLSVTGVVAACSLSLTQVSAQPVVGGLLGGAAGIGGTGSLPVDPMSLAGGGAPSLPGMGSLPVDPASLAGGDLPSPPGGGGLPPLPGLGDLPGGSGTPSVSLSLHIRGADGNTLVGVNVSDPSSLPLDPSALAGGGLPALPGLGDLPVDPTSLAGGGLPSLPGGGGLPVDPTSLAGGGLPSLPGTDLLADPTAPLDGSIPPVTSGGLPTALPADTPLPL